VFCSLYVWPFFAFPGQRLKAVAFAAVPIAVYSAWFMAASQPNHHSEDCRGEGGAGAGAGAGAAAGGGSDAPQARVNWYRHQCSTSQTIAPGSEVAFWLSGGLNLQCEHHLLPIVGRAHIAYLSNERVIGLSKMNRIVDFYAKRPQVQERLTRQIVAALQDALGTPDVACIIDAKHLCVNARGIRDIDSSTVTAEYGGRFLHEEKLRRDLMDYIRLETKFGS
jgi:hypothetical protein